MSIKRRRTQGMRAGVMAVALLLLSATAVFAASHAWVGNKLDAHRVWDPLTQAYVPGNTKGYNEGQTAWFRIQVKNTTVGEELKLRVCLDLDDSSSYFFTELDPYVAADAPPAPGPLTGTDADLARGIDATIDNVIPLGESDGSAGFMCPDNYLEWEVEFTSNADGIVYVVYGGHLAEPGDPLPGGGTVPDGQGASNISGVAQARVASTGTGDKTINFSAGEILPNEAQLSIVKTCADFTVADPFYEILVTNTGPGSALDVTVVDVLPDTSLMTFDRAELTLAPDGGPGSCSLGGDSRTVTCSLDNVPLLPTGESGSWGIKIFVDPTSSGEIPIENTADASTSTPAGEGGSQAVSDTCSSTLPVTLSYFTSSNNDDGTVTFTWQTATETGNAGFNLYASGDDGLERLNSELIQSTVIDSVEATDYSYTAATGATSFYIEDLTIDGVTDVHGPFALGESVGSYIHADPVAPTQYDIFLPMLLNR